MEAGDLLQRGNKFYSVYDTNPRKNEVIVNKIIWNTKEERLWIFHDYEVISFNDIGKDKKYIHIPADDPSVPDKLEILKRKTKIKKLNL